MYLALKHTHMTLALITVLGFTLRGYWMLTDSSLLTHKLARVLPHVVDTLFLATAIGLVVIMRQYPFEAHWVTAKLFGLIAYILLGTVAIKRGRTKLARALALGLALLVFAWLVTVARMKTPWGFLQPLVA